LLGRIAGGDPLARQLAAVKAVMAERREPIRQDREGFLTWLTDAAPHPDAFVPVIVALTESSPVAGDRVVAANGTSPRQEIQRDHPDHPGSMLSFTSGSAIKIITAGVKAAVDRRCQVSISGPAFTLPAKSVSNEKRIQLSDDRREPLAQNIGQL